MDINGLISGNVWFSTMYLPVAIKKYVSEFGKKDSMLYIFATSDKKKQHNNHGCCEILWNSFFIEAISFRFLTNKQILIDIRNSFYHAHARRLK